VKRTGLSRFGWEVAGGLVLLLLLVSLVYLQIGQKPFVQHAGRQHVAAQLRLLLTSASEAEKSAVLATTDEASKEFADRARAATATAEQRRVELAGLVEGAGLEHEKELLAQFSVAFTKFQHIDQELLELAVKNTNLKASALLFGPFAQAANEMDAALSRLIAKSASSSVANERKTMQLAAGAQAGALRIQVLLPPHIAEESDSKMDELEATMRKLDEEIRKDLTGLSSSNEHADVQLAVESYARLSDLKGQIIKLSRENTNVRSLAISLNEKRLVTATCQEALGALEAAIAEEPAARRPFKPR
jgi:hypothetical protein